MPPTEVEFKQLRQMIGCWVRYQGISCQVIEALQEGPALVLVSSAAETTIQPNQYGEAWRRVPEVHIVPVFNSERTALDPAFLELGLLSEGVTHHS